MLNKISHFLKYNNATVIILAVILILGGGALAAGPEGLGEKTTRLEGVDNTALLAADLADFNMDFKIEKLEQDDAYYYATYSYLDLAEADNAWQYQLNQATRKISKKIKQDIGAYLAEYLSKQYQSRQRELKKAKQAAQAMGEQKRLEVTEYSGLVGRTLDLAGKIFPGYEPIKKIELESPDFTAPLAAAAPAAVDNLTQIYNDYLAAHPQLFSPAADAPAPATPEAAISTPEAATSTPAAEPTASSTPEEILPVEPAAAAPAAEPVSVQIIELPAAPAENAPVN